MADKTALVDLVKRLKTVVCESDHTMSAGQQFCPVCGKPVKGGTLTVEERLAQVEAAILELAEVSLSPSRSDDESLWAKLNRIGDKKISLRGGDKKEESKK